MSTLPEVFEVDVTLDDIESGKPCNVGRCGLAVAIYRALVNFNGMPAEYYANFAAVEPDRVLIHAAGTDSSTGGKSFECSDELHEWIDRFDADKGECEPITVMFTNGTAGIKGIDYE